WLELAAVLAGAGRNRALDLIVGPGADALGFTRGDVARHRYAPWPGEFETAGAKLGREFAAALPHRRVAFHAVRNRHKIKALLDRIAHHRIGERLVAARRDRVALRNLVDRIRHRVLTRLDRPQIGNDRVEIAIGHELVESARHDHSNRHAVLFDAFAHDMF